MIFRRRAVLALLTALFALALPATASAEVNIDSAADEPDAVPGGVCETAAGGCTLRAAIEVANAAGTAQDIFFGGEFSGNPGDDTVALTSPLPAIKAPISLIAGLTGPESKPTAGVSGPTGNFGISVEADGVTIRNLSITGALTGINVINKSENFTATGNWIGVKLDGTAGANNTGIFIDPESDGATIGTTVGPPEFVQRNVIAGNNNEGLDIEGASNAVIRNNYFGVAPDGTTQMANNKNIEITNSTAIPGFPAENNEIGATIAGAALTSDACDGGCNVISGGLGPGIDLNGSGLGELPASGPTTVHGNFVGLNAAGTAAIANGEAGIWAGGADHVTVGAATFSTPLPPEANYIAGGIEGIASESGGNDFEARGNSIGFAPDGTDVAAPSLRGILVLAFGVSEEATIESNDVRMAGGTGIEHRFGEGRILQNDVEGGSVGIWQLAEPGGGLIAGNVVESPTDYGILLESPDTDVRRNSIFDSGGAGIRVKNPAGIATNGSRIGNDTAEGENLIEGSDGAAIEIFEAALEPGSTTEIARNRGSDNGGPFIDLVAGANEGIASPVFSSVTKSQAEGTAEAGATVRVFRKASTEAGEIASFLGQAVANGSGKWKVSYPPVPGNTRIAATQTSEDGGTSELAAASVPPHPDPPICADTPAAAMCVLPDPECLGSRCGPPLCPRATGCVPLRPQTTITKGPKAKSAKSTAKFRFMSSIAGSTFECKLDGKPFRKCKSPKQYKNLKPGKHVFKVRAVKGAGNVDTTPAKRKFTVLE